MSCRFLVLLAITMLAFLTVGTTNLHAQAAIGLYNPFNHGLSVGNFPPMEIDERRDRIERVHSFLAAGYSNSESGDFDDRIPDLLPSVQQDVVYQPSNTPTRTQYRNLVLRPEAPETGFGPINNWGYFDPIDQRFSTTPGSGLGPNGGSVTLSSPQFDGIGLAAGSITADGEIKLRLDVQQSSIDGTPIAEAAIQGTYFDTLVIDGGLLDQVPANLSFAASAIIPALDFSKGDFFNYAIGYQAFLYESAVTATSQTIVEHWTAAGFYWADARLLYGPGFLPTGIRIESIGLSPPDMPGVIKFQELLAGDFDGGPAFHKDIREITFDGSYTGGLTYEDPLMPFFQNTLTEDVLLPTNRPLELVVNFFVVAGISNRLFEFGGEFGIDASNSAGFGIQLNDPTASLFSNSGFSYPEQAFFVPEPSSLLVLMTGVFLSVFHRSRRADNYRWGHRSIGPQGTL